MKKTIIMVCSIILCACQSIQSVMATNTVSLHLKSAHYLNPDIHNNSVPVQIRIYQLREAFQFKALKPTQVEQIDEVLKEHVLDKDLYMIRPRSEQNISLNLSQQAQYIGIIALYRKLHKHNWKKLIYLKHNILGQTIRIRLNSRSMTILNHREKKHVSK